MPRSLTDSSVLSLDSGLVLVQKAIRTTVKFGLPCLFLFTASLLTCRTSLAATDGYVEMSYDDLVQELNSKKRKAQNKTQRQAEHPLDQIALHAGFGLTAGVTNLALPNRTVSRSMSGFQLSLGIDLFSPHWIAEGALRNFGSTQQGLETHTLRETDLKVYFKDAWIDRWSYRLGSGLGSRFMRFKDPSMKINIEETTPQWVFAGMIENSISTNLQWGVELGVRTAILGQSTERLSSDLMLKIDTSF